MATFDHELILISEETIYDEIGNPVVVETINSVLCNVNSIGGREFYDAAAQGLKPEIEFVVHRYEYNGEQKVEFEGERYTVIRTYATGFEEIELTCERDVGDD